MPIDFGDIPVQVRPIRSWPKPAGYTTSRVPSRFVSTWTDTVERLKYEIERLSPVRVVVQMDLPEGMIRRDGLPRGDARPHSPAVILSLELEPTRWLNLPCDTYPDWQHNVRAIALTMERLRDIDRWGVSSGEQWEGFKQIPARAVGATPGVHSPQEAAEFIARHAGKADDPAFVESILGSATVREIAYKRAAARLHPDAGGAASDFHTLQAAARMLELNTESHGS